MEFVCSKKESDSLFILINLFLNQTDTAVINGSRPKCPPQLGLDQAKVRRQKPHQGLLWHHPLVSGAHTSRELERELALTGHPFMECRCPRQQLNHH